jgi:DNA polymerase-3 subunit epsilon
LCERYGISNAHRTLHGALLDSELLAEVYLAMTRGQDSLSMDLHGSGSGVDGSGDAIALAEIIVLPAQPDELAAHEDLLKGLDKEAKATCLWRQLAEN